MDDQIPSFLGRLGIVKKLQVRLCDQSAFHEERPVDQPLPKVPSDQHHDHALGFTGLEQRQGFKHFIDRAETAGKGDECFRAKQEVHLSDGKIAKLKTESRRDVGVRVLFVRQRNVEPDRFGVHVRCPTVGRFHDAGASAGHDDVITPALDLARRRDQLTEFSGDLIILRQAELPPGDRHPLLMLDIVRESSRFLLGQVERLFRSSRLVKPRAAEDDDGRSDAFFSLNQFGFQQLQSDSYWTQLVSLQELGVLIGWDIGQGGVVIVEMGMMAGYVLAHGAPL